MNALNQAISSIGIVPVIKLNHPERDAAPLAKALCEGGVPVAEVTFRATGAPLAIKAMKETCPDMIVGAGTVLTTEQIDKAIEAGAQFIVTPGFDPELVAYCQKKDIPVFPGCVTPSEVAQAVKRGLKVVKFFPAEQYGGVSTIKALAAPYTMVKFMPTGGVNAANLKDYLSCDKIVCCGGIFMVKDDLIKAGEFDRIREMTREAVELVRSIRA